MLSIFLPTIQFNSNAFVFDPKNTPKMSVLTDGVGLKNIIQTLLQSSVLHDPSEIVLIFWFAAQETFIIVSVENSN